MLVDVVNDQLYHGLNDCEQIEESCNEPEDVAIGGPQLPGSEDDGQYQSVDRDSERDAHKSTDPEDEWHVVN